MDTIELNEMRDQIAILRNKLNEQEIVNDRMMRGIISSKTDNMKRKMYISILCAIFVIISAPFSFHEAVGLSWYFVIATDIMMVYCMVREYLFKRVINNKTLLSCSMLEVASTMVKFKKDYKQYTISNIFILAPWFGWMLWELYQINGGGPLFTAMAIGLTTGLIIGAIIGLFMFFRIVDSASEIIRQIEDK